MFRLLKEKQSLIDASRKSLAEAEDNVCKLTEECRIARHNSVVLLERNKKLKDTIKNIHEIATSNTYNNDKIILNKIKELARPQNQH